MEASSLNNEFKKYWSLLTSGQKKSVIRLVHSFTNPAESNQQVQEEAIEYETASAVKEEKIFEQLSDKEKFSVMILIKTFLEDDEQSPGSVSIEQYNKEIDEAMKRVESGEYLSHDDLENEAREW